MRGCVVEAVAVFSICFLMNFLGMYATTDAVPVDPSPQTADTHMKKTRVAQSTPAAPGSLLEELMAANEATP